MAANAYAVLSAVHALDVRVLAVGNVNDEKPFALSVLSEPATSCVFLGRGAAKATVIGLVELLAVDDRDAAGELLDRLVEIVAGEPRG